MCTSEPSHLSTRDTEHWTLDAGHRVNLDGEESCRCIQLGTGHSRGAAAGATEYRYPAPTRGRLPCQKRCLGTDGRLGIVVLNYHSKVRRVEPLWVRRTWCRRAVSVWLMSTAYSSWAKTDGPSSRPCGLRPWPQPLQARHSSSGAETVWQLCHHQTSCGVIDGPACNAADELRRVCAS